MPLGFPPICAAQGHEGERLVSGPRPCAGPANMRRGSAQKRGGDFHAHRGVLLPVATAHGAPGYRTGAGGSFCRLRRAIRRPCLGGPFIGAGYRVPLALGYAAGGHGWSCVFNRIRTWVDSSPIRLARLLGSWPLDASAFAPAVAHLSPDRGRVPCSWCCLASLVTFSGRQSPPLSCHRWPGSCARLAPRSALALQAAADSSLHPLSYSRFERACLCLFWGVSPATQKRCPVLVGMASVPAKKNE